MREEARDPDDPALGNAAFAQDEIWFAIWSASDGFHSFVR